MLRTIRHRLLVVATSALGLMVNGGLLRAAPPADASRFTDDKGHFRPDWRAGINRPAAAGSVRQHETVGQWVARNSRATDAGPYALTGEAARVARAGAPARVTDDKGHFRPDWHAGINAPGPVARD